MLLFQVVLLLRKQILQKEYNKQQILPIVAINRVCPRRNFQQIKVCYQLLLQAATHLASLPGILKVQPSKQKIIPLD